MELKGTYTLRKLRTQRITGREFEEHYSILCDGKKVGNIYSMRLNREKFYMASISAIASWGKGTTPQRALISLKTMLLHQLTEMHRYVARYAQV
jgi:hypothetical protein